MPALQLTVLLPGSGMAFIGFAALFLEPLGMLNLESYGFYASRGFSAFSKLSMNGGQKIRWFW
jgi:hypothetical protein